METAESTRADALLLRLDELRAIVACPSCASSLPLNASGRLRCPGCAAEYRRLEHAWDLTPPRDRWSDGQWEAWEQLQANGVASYNADPTHNLGVGDRADYVSFSEFCGLSGRVLDVGCGPQPWPAHFRQHAKGTRFVGIDPLVGDTPARYTRVRGLAEHLPFADAVFDHVVLATTIDHFVDPEGALSEANRVRSPDGSIEVWIGHKAPDAPSPPDSPGWYRNLLRPEGAEDVFHLKRLDADEAEALFAAAGLRIVERQVHEVDAWRTNFFFRLTP